MEPAWAPAVGRREHGTAMEADLDQSGLTPGIVAGYVLIGVGLTVLLVGLLWSAGRRLRNLPDDPRATRVLIVAGLVMAALGVVLGAISIRAA